MSYYYCTLGHACADYDEREITRDEADVFAPAGLYPACAAAPDNGAPCGAPLRHCCSCEELATVQGGITEDGSTWTAWACETHARVLTPAKIQKAV